MDFEKLKIELQAYIQWFEEKYNYTDLRDINSIEDWQLYVSAKQFINCI